LYVITSFVYLLYYRQIERHKDEQSHIMQLLINKKVSSTSQKSNCDNYNYLTENDEKRITLRMHSVI